MTEVRAVYTIKMKSNREHAEKILQQIDELFLWFEGLFPNMEVEV